TNYNQRPHLNADIFISPKEMKKYGTVTTLEEAPRLVQLGYDEAKAQLKNFKERVPERWWRMALNPSMVHNHHELAINIPKSKGKKLIDLLLHKNFSLIMFIFPILIYWNWHKIRGRCRRSIASVILKLSHLRNTWIT